jgi:uncharacterized protein
MMWTRPGPDNTEPTLAAAVKCARARGVDHLVVASNTGATLEALLALDVRGLQLVGVTHQVGFKRPGEHEMSAEARARLTSSGVALLTTTHLFGGVDRTISRKFGGLFPPDTIANALRMFGQGVKVAVEISIMALDAGLIPHGVDVIAIGGTSTGADAACVVRPGHSLSAFDTRVVEIVCRPAPFDD